MTHNQSFPPSVTSVIGETSSSFDVSLANQLLLPMSSVRSLQVFVVIKIITNVDNIEWGPSYEKTTNDLLGETNTH